MRDPFRAALEAAAVASSQHRPRASRSIKHTKIFEMVMQILSSTLSPQTSNTTLSIADFIDDSAEFSSLTTMSSTSIRLFTNQSVYNETDQTAKSQWHQTKFMCIVAIGSIFAILTTVGNLMVMVSFKIDKQLQTISNYFLFSLAVADIAIGIVSIPLMTYYMAVDTHWGIGYTMCQFWLCLDYFMSNASVLNLLLISFDRYFSVTRPLTYRPRRTAKKALTMIASTYIISLILWPPWIISWPHIEGRFTNEEKCVVQFIETNQFASVGTAIAAFYLPLSIMIVLYSRVYYETKKRQKEMTRLQAGQLRQSLSKREIHSTTSSTSLTAKNSFNRNNLLPAIRYPDGIREESKTRKRSCLRSCLGRSGISSDDSSSDVTARVAADDTSLRSSSMGSMRRPNSKHSPHRSPSLSQHKDSSKKTSDMSGHYRNSSGQFRSRKVDRPPTYTVLIELKDGEGKRPSVRLSSCEADELPGQAGKDDQRKSDKERRKNERKQESKAAKTLSAILFAFIITWTPYNVIVCWEAFYKHSIPEVYFHIGYCLCYINSTINPLCYALCNARFRMTYMRILKGRWKQQRSNLMRDAYLVRI
ncbi:unnamed protein product [Anisakis simplex]|uniref:Muscarinic acetylcholine receptor gar-3 (inferred by orthology to a C. elegans protein) n=1 Tax=Anisakis simplex TaxID=6269 RepID=A0A0M3JXQ1_ANISI|nr:unnamed protein product [Anisakis simplex]